MVVYWLAYGLVITLSLANTILLLWLGFMVLLNAERRSWGVALIGGGLLTGGALTRLKAHLINSCASS